MLEWLQLPLDLAREHNVSTAVAWHGRLMVLAWSFLLPTGVIVARFFKITPRQNWPQQLDNKIWWISHLLLQYAGCAAILLALGLIWLPAQQSAWTLHTQVGWLVVAASVGQIMGGWLRGSKGGASAPAADGSLTGDHYDMTPRRKVFEHAHKALGYFGLLLSTVAVMTGFWLVNAPRWMPILCLLWWALIVIVWIILQRRGFAVSTYQAIWGAEPSLPGNSIAPNWGMHQRVAEPNQQDAPNP